MEELNGYWPDGMEDELIRELVGDESPFFMSPQTTDSEASVSPRPLTNLPLSTVYPGPRIKDIESALSVTTNKGSIPQPRFSIMEKGLSKIENKYTLKIKTCVNGLTDDGYKWRKYGQKSIKNSLNPRSYYRCTNPRCSAKKQVEKCSEDPDTLIVTYEGLHLHFAYSHFFQAPPQHVNSPTKKPKSILQVQEALAEKESNGMLAPTPSSTITKESQQEPIKEVEPQGLLEDVVPLMIRNPSNRSVSNSSCSSSYPSSPPTSSSSSLSWSPTYSSCFDASIISSMR